MKLPMISVMVVATFLMGCASLPKLTGSEKIAVVDFSLNQSIVKQGSKPDTGPGLLDNKETYWQYQKQAVAQAWEVFKAKAAEVFGKYQLVDPSTIENNADLLALTAPQKLSMMGLSRMSDDGFVHPEGLNYVNQGETKVIQGLAAKTGADLLCLVDLQASYDMANGLAINGIGGGNAAMTVTVNLTLVDKDGKIVRVGRANGVSKETVVIVGIGLGDMSIDKKTYPKLLASAMDAAIPGLKATVAAW